MVTHSETTALRRPGIYFQTQRAAIQPDLPPLDVAAFVGFAQRGPIDIPVAVEDLDTYRAIFGGDLAVARTVNGAIRYASLPTAVAGFFANGGRRCYVVRVVGPAASASRFSLPGLVGFDTTGGSASSAVPVTVDAASPGRWSATLQLATQLRRLPLATDTIRLDEPGYLAQHTHGAVAPIESGELLHLTFGDAEPHYLLTVVAVTERGENTALADEPAAPQRFQITQARRSFSTAVALQGALGDTTSPPVSSPPVNTTAIGVVGGVVHITEQGETLLFATGSLFAAPGDAGFTLVLTADDVIDDDPPVALPFQVGDLLQLTLAAATAPATVLTLLLPIEALSSNSTGAASPLAAELLVQGSTLLEREPTPTFPVAAPLLPLERVERLRFDLLVQDATQQRTIIRDLGFDANHSRFWGDLILLESSRLLQQPIDADRARQAAARYRARQQPRRDPQLEAAPLDLVALAGQLAPIAQSGWQYLPLGMGAFFAVDQAAAAGGGTGHPLRGDDDLATTYGAALFVDDILVPNPTVQSRTATTLGQQITDRYGLQYQRLRGIHCLYPIDEVALIAVPDAIHVAWRAAPSIEPPPPPPPEPGPTLDRSRFHACAASAPPPEDAPEEAAEDAVSPPETTNGPAAISRDIAHLPLLAAHAEADRILDFAGTYATLLEIHHALINLGQARRDWVAILTLPEHFGLRHGREWSTALRTRLGLPSRAGSYRGLANLADLSYAAVYHPWLYTTAVLDAAARDAVGATVSTSARAAGGVIRTVPPDGAVCGVIAARALERGAWVAPANVPLQQVLGLQPRISEAEWTELFTLGFNLVRTEPLDFRMMSAHTLSDEREWLQLSVRRLLILLRKVALERGMAYVFENNGEPLRNAIALTFDRLLRQLFDRGALAGATTQQAYRIVLDDRINGRADSDNGRFFVELQVAPAQPLEFITVRLLRTTDGDLQLAELRPGG